MFKLDANYTDYRDDQDPNMPGGAAVPASTPQSFDGTPWRFPWFNHLHGFFQALYIRAFGSLDGISGQPDHAFQSDGLKAIDRIIEKKFEDQYLIKDITGEEPVIPLGDIPAFVINDVVVFPENSRYVIFISPHGNYPEFLNFGAEIDLNGLHVYPRRFIDGKIIPGTRKRKWGQFKWGNGKWGQYGSMPINIIIKERI